MCVQCDTRKHGHYQFWWRSFLHDKTQKKGPRSARWCWMMFFSKWQQPGEKNNFCHKKGGLNWTKKRWWRTSLYKHEMDWVTICCGPTRFAVPQTPPQDPRHDGQRPFTPRTCRQNTCRTPHFHMYRHSAYDTAQMTCAHWMAQDELCAERHSFIHASCLFLCCTRHSKREMKRLHDEHVKETSEGNTPIHPAQRSRQRRGQQFEGLENTIIKSMPKQDGEPILRSHGETCRGIQHIRPREISRSNTMIGSRTNSWNSWRSSSWTEQWWFLSSEMPFFFACRKVNSLAIYGRCRQIHLPHATFSHVQLLHRLHSTDDMCSMSGSRRVVRRKTLLHPRVMSHSLLHATLNKFSLTCLSCVVVVFFSESRPVVHVSTAKIHGSMALLRKTLLHRRPGWYWRDWCQKICPAANHWYIQLTIRQKVLRRRPTRTSKTNTYVRWLHHFLYGNERKMKDKHELITLNEKAWCSSLLGIRKYQGNLIWSVYRSEKQMHNEHKLITQDEKAWWQVRLESSKFQGNLMRCFRATVNRVRTRFPKETEVTNRETHSRIVFVRTSSGIS